MREIGIYSITKSFEHDGIYHVQTRVTVRDSHVMPTTKVVVGKVSEEEMSEINKEESQQEHGGDHSY